MRKKMRLQYKMLINRFQTIQNKKIKKNLSKVLQVKTSKILKNSKQRWKKRKWKRWILIKN